MSTLLTSAPPGLYRRYVSLVLLLVCILLLVSVLPAASRAAGVVTVPTEAALNAAMQGGGLVTFACDGVIRITKTTKVGPGAGGDSTTILTLDATGHNITLDGGGNIQFLNVLTTGVFGGDTGTPYELTFTHLTLAISKLLGEQWRHCLFATQHYNDDDRLHIHQ